GTGQNAKFATRRALAGTGPAQPAAFGWRHLVFLPGHSAGGPGKFPTNCPCALRRWVRRASSCPSPYRRAGFALWVLRILDLPSSRRSGEVRRRELRTDPNAGSSSAETWTYGLSPQTL